MTGSKPGVRKAMSVADVFGRWTVAGLKPVLVNGHYRVRCRCECGTERDVAMHHLRSGQSQSCGCLARERTRDRNRSDAGNWRGGRILTDEGYVHVYEPTHPNAKSNGYVPEHRLVMSRALGRPLEGGENVHHINGDKQDNRPENLELWTTSQPAGQRVEDKLAWAYAFIEKYGEKEN